MLLENELTIYYKFNLPRWLSPDCSNVMAVTWSAPSKVGKTKHQKPSQKTPKSLHFSQHFLVRSLQLPLDYSLSMNQLCSHCDFLQPIAAFHSSSWSLRICSTCWEWQAQHVAESFSDLNSHSTKQWHVDDDANWVCFCSECHFLLSAAETCFTCQKQTACQVQQHVALTVVSKFNLKIHAFTHNNFATEIECSVFFLLFSFLFFLHHQFSFLFWLSLVIIEVHIY